MKKVLVGISILGLMMSASTAFAISVDSTACANPTLEVNISASIFEAITHQDVYVRGTNSDGYSWTIDEPLLTGTGVHYYFNFGNTPIGDFVDYTIFTPQTNLGSGSCDW